MDEPLPQAQPHQPPTDFQALYDSLGGRVYNLAYRFTGNAQDASDITQDTFLHVYRGLPGFRGESQPSTWVMTIARNTCLHWLERTRRRTFISFEDMIHTHADPQGAADLTDGQLAVLTAQVKDGCYLGLVRCLPANQRMAFITHVLFHYPIREVAAILGKSEGATKLLVHRARENIKRFLCKNCSLFDADNFCQCRNMIGFSLKNGWIDPSAHPGAGLDVSRIESEVQDFRTVLAFYRGLPELDWPAELQRQIHQKEWEIFPQKP